MLRPDFPLKAAPAGSIPAGKVECDHCGLPVPLGLFQEGQPRQFCCQGCRVVFETIQESGLGRFYDLARDAPDRIPGRTTGRAYDEFDDPAFQGLYQVQASAELARLDLYLEGVHCAACVWLVERLPRVLAGVVDARLDLRRSVARVTFDPAQVALSRVARTLDAFGYPCHPYRAERLHEHRRQEERKYLIRIGVAGALAGNVMLIAFALYGGMLSGISDEHRMLLRGFSLLLTLVAIAWPGATFFRGAVSALRARTVHMDLPVALALSVGTVWGALNTLRGTGEVYFESLSAVVFLLLIGRWVQIRQQRSASDAVELLSSLTPGRARVVEGAVVREVPVEALRAGQTVEIRAGDSVPADGVIREGKSHFDLSLLTGESEPRQLLPGDRAHAGTTSLDGRIELEVQSTGEETRVGRLMALVEECSRRQPPIVLLADRLARLFVRVVLLLAAATALLWLWLDPSRAVEHAVALLIVTCPCALGLATPLAVVAGVGKAAARGILVKGGTTLERLSRSGLVILDKTGTVTRGETRLLSWQGDDSLRGAVAALESQVSHPIARACVTAFEGERIALPVEGVRYAGAGVEGTVDGRFLRVGSVAWVTGRGDRPADWAVREARRLSAAALTPIYVAADGEVRAVAGFGDPIQEDARFAIDRLRRMGWTIRLLSGDHQDVVAAVGERIGIDADLLEGGASPERKLEVVEQESLRHPVVVMVGDGVNDAAALSAAHVGVAVHGGAEASLAAADVYLSRPGLTPVVELLAGARRTVGVIRRNLAVSLLYNLVSGSLAIAGLIHPLTAAILMPLSSLTVVTLSYRSRTFEG